MEEHTLNFLNIPSNMKLVMEAKILKKSAYKLYMTVLALAILLPAFQITGSANVLDDVTISHVIEDGVTQEAFSYEDAITESVFVETGLDTDMNGELDRIAVDIIRPAETEDGLQVPVIMDASPYYESLGRGSLAETKRYDEDGNILNFPLYYDNYFVPRGYAVVLVDMIGTNRSDGCPTTGGFEETASAVAAIDWLNGRARAWDVNGEEVTADWSTGKVGMYGKSYDGTLANSAAATGVDGLETIVPVGAISSWYHYYRQNGVTLWNNGPNGLANTVVSSERRQACAPVRESLAALMDDASGNYNEFWDDRNYVKDAENVKASVFLYHGVNDLNVKTNHFGEWWTELEKNNVPRKIWLTQTGHTEPFDIRREEWVNTIHRWFDYWLLDIENGIMDEPMADVEHDPEVWTQYSSWPDEDAKTTRLRLGPSKDEANPGILTNGPVQGRHTATFTNVPRTETQLVSNPTAQDDRRLVFLSTKLTEDIRLSGTPEMDIRVKINGEAANLTAYLVDYGRAERVQHTFGEGIRALSTRDCWGQSSDEDSACFPQHVYRTTTQDYNIVTRGFMDAQNYKNFEESNPLRDHRNYRMQWETYTHDYVFKEGHQIGIVIASSTRSRTVPNWDPVDVEVYLGQSKIEIPIVGGKKAVDF